MKALILLKMGLPIVKLKSNRDLITVHSAIRVTFFLLSPMLVEKMMVPSGFPKLLQNCRVGYTRSD